MTRLDRIGCSIAAICLIGVFFAFVKSNKENTQVENQCIKTELYVIGNKGFLTRVYDCSNSVRM